MGGAGHQVQADETYYGNTSKRAKGYKKGHSNKSSVVALVNPATGEARAFKVETANAETINAILHTNVHRASTLVTDESALYKSSGYHKHETVLHAGKEYVNKDGFTTNNVENFFGIFKKGKWSAFITSAANSTCSVTWANFHSATATALALALMTQSAPTVH